MPKRRPLTAGIKSQSSTDQKKEAAFVYGKKPKSKNPSPGSGSPDQPAGQPGRSPLSTRIRADLASALKQASLKRQLSGETPNTVQDILEDVLEPWLREKGYLP